MEAGYWISILMAFVATASAIVTYAVFRSSTDPLVIVYADPDLKRPSVINLIIKNIGNGAAHSISFDSNKPLPKKAFSIEIPDEMPEAMNDGPIITGIPFLAPDQQIVLPWGQYGGLFKYIGESPIEVESSFYRVGKPRFFSRRLRSKSSLDIKMFKESDSSEHGFGPNLVKELNQINKTVSTISSALNASERMTSRIEDIEKAITQIPQDQLRQFREWYEKFDADTWDKEIEKNVAAGKLDDLTQSAAADHKTGKSKAV